MSRHLLTPLLALSVVFAWGCEGLGASGAAPTTHTYYIAADEVVWDYAPTDMNRIKRAPFGEAEAAWAVPGPLRVGKVYKKALYREYTDETFTTLKPRAPEWEHLGLLGPLLRAEVGDTIVVVYRNNAPFPSSLHPHGVFYNKDSEGAPYYDETADPERADDGVPPGGTHTYVWPVPERAGPAEGDPSSVFWMYHSHTDEIADVNAGLIGPMIITGRGRSRPDGTPDDVDREIVIAFAEMMENESHYIRHNLDTYAGDASGLTLIQDPFALMLLVGEGGFADYNFMETLNGFIYGNLPSVEMRVGERVRWYLMASTNFEFHAPHWHGNVVVAERMRTDVAGLLPMGMLVADMVPDNPGIWLFHCHVSAHLRAGMESVYRVLPAGSDIGGSSGG